MSFAENVSIERQERLHRFFPKEHVCAKLREKRPMNILTKKDSRIFFVQIDRKRPRCVAGSVKTDDPPATEIEKFLVI